MIGVCRSLYVFVVASAILNAVVDIRRVNKLALSYQLNQISAGDVDFVPVFA